MPESLNFFCMASVTSGEYGVNSAILCTFRASNAALAAVNGLDVGIPG